jgi:predicted transposase/invertase (TIGR01784 family)
MDLKIDFAFKQLFGTEGNEPILRSLVNAILKMPKGEQIASLTIMNSEIFREHEEDKKSVLDIYARTEKGESINIEIQVANKYDMVKRTLYYWSRIYAAQMKKNIPYANLKKTVTINIVDFDLIKETKRYHSTFRLYENKEKFLLTDVMEVHFVEMRKLVRLWEQQAINLDENQAERWLLLLEADEREDIRKELEAIAVSDPVMKQAFEQWEDLSRDDKKWFEYESRRKAILDEIAMVQEAEIRQEKAREEGLATGRVEGLAEGRVEGLATGRVEGLATGRVEGRTEGERQKATEVARNMLAKAMDTSLIADLTGLSVEEIEKLKQQPH